jgi:Na+-transporting methylmalonyl-CoA/oxaloacetate decarboxylase gamma subunit
MELTVLKAAEKIPANQVLDIPTTLMISGVAVLFVFAVLIIIILVSGGFSKGIALHDKKTKILPREENAILDEDEDAAVAALVATIEFNKETKENARLKSIKRID